ncbi:TetR/AcrR family transcriptional regulator [Christensenellaceae bacterium OttesenSCG-928-M15]|nr:TetR/AcrR family transcriptional regulator [Christensenellaceae bacterium OttesenSCG-928-M15]
MDSKGPQLNKRQQQYQATQDAIYAAVNALVKVMPFEKIRIQDICAQAGISLGTFYHYFSNKNDLLIDRYKRTNRHFEQFYEEELTGLHAVDALKRMVAEFAQYIKTRLPDILVPYYMAYLQNIQKWRKDEPGVVGRVYMGLIEEGLRTGELQSRYTAEQLHRYISSATSGLIVSQCISQGTFLDDEDSLIVLLDWIEGLRGEPRVESGPRT